MLDDGSSNGRPEGLHYDRPRLPLLPGLPCLALVSDELQRDFLGLAIVEGDLLRLAHEPRQELGVAL